MELQEFSPRGYSERVIPRWSGWSAVARNSDEWIAGALRADMVTAPSVDGGAVRDCLYREFTPLVKLLVRQYGKTDEQRQDLEGEIYWQYCGHLKAYDPSRGVPLRPYIVRLLSASVYTYARKQWKLEEREMALNQTDGDHPALTVDPTPTWVHNVSQQQVIASLPLSLSKLPDRQRQVVIMRYYEQRSFEEIAKFLDIKPATARSLLRHGLHNLRKHINPMDCADV